MGILLVIILGSITCATSIESITGNQDDELKIFYNGTLYADGTQQRTVCLSRMELSRHWVQNLLLFRMRPEST